MQFLYYLEATWYCVKFYIIILDLVKDDSMLNHIFSKLAFELINRILLLQ
jgi:hypothetical protein